MRGEGSLGAGTQNLSHYTPYGLKRGVVGKFGLTCRLNLYHSTLAQNIPWGKTSWGWVGEGVEKRWGRWGDGVGGGVEDGGAQVSDGVNRTGP